jgi:NAD+ synthase (glutamine-hydrolysing)
MLRALANTEAFAPAKDVILDILDTPISPELLPPAADGAISQQTEDIVGPYVLHDYYLYYVVRYGFTPKKIYTLACRAFDGVYTPETIKKWLGVFYTRFFSQQYKRSCMPEGVKVGSVCLSPRGDWRMPSEACVRLWLQEVEKL